MITKETAARIWECYREISAANKLLEDMKMVKDQCSFGEHERRLKDAFGTRQDLQLGIPSGENSHRLFNVSPTLAKSVITAHIGHKKAELTEANEQARVELEPIRKEE